MASKSWPNFSFKISTKLKRGWLERFRESSHARVTSVKSQQEKWVTEWQGKAMIGLESDKNYIFLSFWETCAGHPVASMPHAGRGRRLSFQRGDMPRARFYRLGLRETMLGLQDERPLSKIEKNGLAGGLLCSWLADYSMQGENNRWRLITTNASSSSIGTSPPFLEQQQRCISASSPAGMAGVVSLYRLQRGSAKRFPPSEQQQ